MMRMSKIITIDGPAGAGKSTVSKALAGRLQYMYLDTGALYRALALKSIREGVPTDDPTALAELCATTQVHIQNNNGEMSVFVDGENVDRDIRSEDVGQVASAISARPIVREKLLALQRQAGQRGGVVAEGRDMGSVVFPDADVKFYLDADIHERIRRRHLELADREHSVDIEKVAHDMRLRDEQDSQRKIAPLVIAPDAIRVDSTGLEANDVVAVMIDIIENRHKTSEVNADERMPDLS